MKNWLSIFLALVGVALLAGIAYSFRPSAHEVDLAVVERRGLRVTVDEDGKTRIREKYVVSAPLAGRLLRIDLDPGDTVVHDQTVLATIEPRDPELLDSRSIAQAEARVRGAEAALNQSEPMVRQAEIDQADAEADLARIRRVREKGGATEEAELDVQARFQRASEQLRSARYAGEIAAFELEQARAALLHSRPDSAGTEAEDWTFTIRSPVDGRVLRVFQESAAVVGAGASLLELGDPTDLEVEIDVLSSDAVKVSPGDRVLLEHWGGDAPLIGRVRLVEPAGFTKISTLGVEEQRVYVIVDLDAPPAERKALGDGFRVEARIVIDEVEDALVIPASALFRTGEGLAVFVDAEGVAEQRTVEVGRHNSLEAEVTAGLSEGESVVVHPSDQVEDGVAIRER
ncbi:putative efflux system component YknX [Pseudobythopirellula maris]|uniref:Putative efflux system component YknX n=1 Tax=Pseudobythopirellula maris TaxID=2527991 RepID=A0A5C5ZKE4_9BACT|nr:HlyD family efflux transporter periplasmic adaptor subunit [Pseudobythopirellula maris]TWT87690.1 putative efflux system component YknX [Pseudobythopirellula maris]